MRFLCRWMEKLDSSDPGLVSSKKFRRAAERVDLDLVVAEELFKAADLHDQRFLDYENLATIFLDVDGMDDAKLLNELRSVLNHAQGPAAQRAPDHVSGASPSMEPTLDLFVLQTRFRDSNDEVLRSALAELKGVVGPRGEITAEALLGILRQPPVQSG